MPQGDRKFKGKKINGKIQFSREETIWEKYDKLTKRVEILENKTPK